MNDTEWLEEALEKLWKIIEEDSLPLKGHDNNLDRHLEVPLERLVEEGLLERSEAGVCFTTAGKKEAALAVRRHRLSERLFHDIIEVDQTDMEEAACQVEHIVKKGIEEEICRLLGHPVTCPHGKSIPPGDCCRMDRVIAEKTVIPLTSLKPGEQGSIAYIKVSDSKKLQKLMAMGVLPGNDIVLEGNFPSFVFSVGLSRYAVDADMAEAIIVKKEG